jgi:hypothetical protein
MIDAFPVCGRSNPQGVPIRWKCTGGTRELPGTEKGNEKETHQDAMSALQVSIILYVSVTLKVKKEIMKAKI